MATTVQFRRGSTADNNNFTGKLGEITVDTDTWQLRVHDNVTVGGHTVNGSTTNIVGAGGTVTSVGLSGGSTGLLVTTSGSTYSAITAAGTFTLSGTLNKVNGGTGTTNPVMTATAPVAVTGTWPNVNVAITGTVATANGGTGITTSPAANQVLLGTGSGYALTTLVAGNGVTFDQTQANILTIKSSGGTGSGNTITLADMPPGSIQWFAMQTPPAGWLECDGRILSRTANNNQYAPLWAAIQYTYGGTGDSFTIPDLRGQFLRGWDHNTTVPSLSIDPNRVFGSTQADAFKSHTHAIDSNHDNSTYGTRVRGTSSTQVDGTQLSQATGGTETRPTNVAMIACIKYTAGVATQVVTSVNVDGGTTGLVFSGGPITSTGNIIASGTLAVANGGTGITVANPAWHLTLLAPSTSNPNGIALTLSSAQSYLVRYNRETTKQNVTYNSVTGSVTVTVPGIYHLYAQVQYVYIYASYYGLSIVKNGAVISEAYDQSSHPYGTADGITGTVYCSVTIPLAVGDEVHVTYNYNATQLDNTGVIPSIQTQLYPNRNYFGGYRVG